MRSVEFRIRNDPAHLAILREALDRLAKAHSIADRALIALQVTLDEIVSNVIKTLGRRPGRITSMFGWQSPIPALRWR